MKEPHFDEADQASKQAPKTAEASSTNAIQEETLGNTALNQQNTPPLLLDAQGLSRYFDQHCAVQNLDLSLHKGEVLGLLGPNGAGKSTTLQMLTGNLAPSTGQIQINGVDLLDNPREAKQHLGYLPEQPPVYRDMRVDEYLHYCARLHHLSGKKATLAVDNAKQHCGLTEVGTRLIGLLSKGYQQRVGIAQAILHQPDVVVLDEPTVGLDPIQIREIRHLIRELGNHHSVILSTHILPEVQAVCDRVQLIHQGQTVFNDRLQDLAERHAQPVLNIRFSKAMDLIADLKKDISTARQLKNIGIQRIVPISPQEYAFHHAVGEAIVPKLMTFAVANQWAVSAMIPQIATLEQIFMDLVHNEQEAAADDNTTDAGHDHNEINNENEIENLLLAQPDNKINVNLGKPHE
ncbi:MAG TPA: ABC transporter ATP-binding protein [Thiothrix sp.]|nr:ABC transporter ATP-binding protein [Thiothrix sp.]